MGFFFILCYNGKCEIVDIFLSARMRAWEIFRLDFRLVGEPVSFEVRGIPLAIGLMDVVDIILVAFLIYKLYVILENTRAATLAKGIIVLIFIRAISGFFDLNVFNWLLEHGIAMLTVALPVVFQPELRRALEQLGRGRLFHKRLDLTERDLDDLLDAVTSSCKVMSEHKVGALMVFEGYSGLEERIDTGVHMDCLVSDPLLQQIFIKDTPLHDGAVIIRGNRIIAASCVLILTDNRNLDQSLGTRHRAAIGVSEMSDCMAVVVSEETGAISIAKNGSLMRYLTPKDMRKILEQHVKDPIRKRESFVTKLHDKILCWWEGKKHD